MAEQKFDPIAQMTMKKMGCDPKDAIREKTSVYMARIFGEAVDVKTKEGKNGDPYSYLVGSFRAITAEGKSFESEKLFLPGGIMESIETTLKQLDGKPVQFAYDIFSTPDDNTVGYRYAAKTLVKSEASDRLAALTADLDKKGMPTKKEKEKAK